MKSNRFLTLFTPGLVRRARLASLPRGRARCVERRTLLHSSSQNIPPLNMKTESSSFFRFLATASAGGLAMFSFSNQEASAGDDHIAAPAGVVLTSRMHLFNSQTRSDKMDKVAIYSGNSNLTLARNIAHYLSTQLSDASIGKFNDGETSVKLNESCRGKNVFIIQSICGDRGGNVALNDSLMELLLMISAARRASAYRITAVVPYFAYARQNRKVPNARVTIAVADIATLLSSMGVDRVVTIDFHSPETEGCFPNRVNVTNVLSTSIGAAYFSEKNLVNPVVVSSKDGGIYRAKSFCAGMATKGYSDVKFASFIKETQPDGRSKRILLGDVTDSDCIIVDDIIDTGTTVVKRAKELRRAGARRVFAFATHGVFSGNSEKLVSKTPYLDEIVVSDTIPFNEGPTTGKVKRLSLAPLIAETIRRVYHMQSTGNLTEIQDGRL